MNPRQWRNDSVSNELIRIKFARSEGCKADVSNEHLHDVETIYKAEPAKQLQV